MQIKTSPRRRICRHPLCKQVLNIYNHEAYCYVHLGSTFWKDNFGRGPIKKSIRRAV